MYAYQGMSYWDAYKLPVPVRKWMIRRFNKRQKEMKEKSSDTPPADRPLTMSERLKLKGQFEGNQSKLPKNLFSPTRK